MVGEASAAHRAKTSEAALSAGIAPHQDDAAGPVGIPLQGAGGHPTGMQQTGDRLTAGIAAQPADQGAGGAQFGQGTGDIGRGTTDVILPARGGQGGWIGIRGKQPIDQGFPEAEHLRGARELGHQVGFGLVWFAWLGLGLVWFGLLGLA